MTVKDFCIFMLRREVLAYKGKKMLSNVCGYLFAERGAEPNYIAAALTWVTIYWFGLVFDLFIEPTVFQAIVVLSLCVFKLLLIARLCRYPITDHCWELCQNV